MNLDARLTLLFNGMGQPWLDPIVLTLTDARTWIPLYLLMLIALIRRFGRRRTLMIILGVACVFMLTEGVSSGLCKPLVQRLRPTHEPMLEGLVRVVDGYRGGLYGFFSSHAANTCGVATFLSLFLRRRWATATLAAYCLINCWTRLYLAVHYVGDVSVGIVWGLLSGWLVYRLLMKYFFKDGAPYPLR